jgi:hypothetical protein
MNRGTSVSAPGAFVQIFEFSTDRVAEYDRIQDRFAEAIGDARTTRWSILAADRDRPGRYLAVVEFPSYAEAMANSGHPATGKFVAELRAICDGEPEFRNLDVVQARPY